MTPPDDLRLPALARATIDRAADERTHEGLLEALRADPTTRVVALHGDQAPLQPGGGASALLLVSPSVIADGAQWAFLGRDDDGSARLVAAVAAATERPVDAEDWGSLRVVGGELSPVESGLLVEAVALGRWLLDAPFCPACGGRTIIRTAGWSRSCPDCGRAHFPRTDPAVIVAVASADGSRLLLGKNAMWKDRNVYSTFAGFVEAGESAEATIIREVHEEAGVTVDGIRYRGSQAWPYPRSLMLGFHASAVDDAAARPDGEEIVDVRWFSRTELTAALAGEADFALPGTASIARRLILDWVEYPA
ncbi:NAD(+) diphosphatase [uncultured Microbacterium sp.]|uniref:NAD(+) diphosphatase n=1 Tax=uncultured Microbacterium sp. TaxID=191216 RepID=UPI0026210EC8|nr:NAD(+) diphosphatase [uncultured Microbacterium sp.]